MKKMFWLEEGLQYTKEEIGNKAFLLAKLKNDNVNIPKTFIISDQVFKEFLVYNKLLGKIYLNLYDIIKSKYNVAYSEGYLIAELQNKLNIIQKLVYQAKFDEDTGNDIKYFYESMKSNRSTDLLSNNSNTQTEVALKLSLNDERSSKELGYVNYIDINSLASLYLHVKACFAEFFTTKFFVNMMKKYGFIDLFKKEVKVDETQFKNKFIELIEQVKYNIVIQEKKSATKSGFLITNTSKKIYDNYLYLIHDGDFTKNFSDHYAKLYKIQNVDVAPMQYYLVNINNSIIFGNYGYNLTSSEIREMLNNKHRLLEEIHSDRYLVDNNLLEVVYRDIRRQEKKVVFVDSRFNNEAVDINSQNDQKINDKELLEISRINKKLDGIFLVDYLYENNVLYVLNVDILEDLIGTAEGNIRDLAKKKIEEVFDSNTINNNAFETFSQKTQNISQSQDKGFENQIDNDFKDNRMNNFTQDSNFSFDFNNTNQNDHSIQNKSFDLESKNQRVSRDNQGSASNQPNFEFENFAFDLNNSENNSFDSMNSGVINSQSEDIKVENNIAREENYPKTLNELYNEQSTKRQEINDNLFGTFNNDNNNVELNNYQDNGFNNESIFSNEQKNTNSSNEFIFNESVFNELNTELENKNNIINSNFKETVSQDVGIGDEIKKYLEVHSEDFSRMDDESLDSLISNNLKEMLMYLYLKRSKTNPAIKDKILKNIVDNYDNLKQDRKKLLDYLKMFFN